MQNPKYTNINIINKQQKYAKLKRTNKVISNYKPSQKTVTNQRQTIIQPTTQTLIAITDTLKVTSKRVTQHINQQNHKNTSKTQSNTKTTNHKYKPTTCNRTHNLSRK